MAALAGGNRAKCPVASRCRRRVESSRGLPLAATLHQPQEAMQRPIGHAELIKMAHGIDKVIAVAPAYAPRVADRVHDARLRQLTHIFAILPVDDISDGTQMTGG